MSLALPDGLTSVAWPSLRTTFNLPLDALGAFVTTVSIGYLLSSFSSGRILARIGVGWLLVCSCLTTAISLLGYSLAPLWAVMVAFGLLAGLGAGAIDAGLNTYAAETFSPRNLNWLHASFGLGATIGPLLMSGVISAGQPYRLGYLIVGVVQLLLASCFALTRKQWEAHRTASEIAPTPSAPMLHTIQQVAAWLSILLFFLYAGLELTAGQWLYTLLTEARGTRPALAGLWVSLFWGSLAVGRVVSGAIIERLTVHRLLWLCMAGSLAAVVLLWLNLTAWLTCTGVILLGLSLAPMFPSFMSLTPARMGPAHTANTVGFQLAATMLGGAALVSGFGLLAARIGLETLGPFLLVTASLLIVVFALLEREGRT